MSAAVIRTLVIALSGVSTVHANPISENLKLRLATSFRYEDNLFRLPDGSQPPVLDGSRSRSDTATTLSAGVSLEVPISRQRLVLSYDLAQSKYNTYSTLDFTGYDGRTVLRWEAGRLLTGEMGVASTRSQSSFADVVGIVPNVRTATQYFFNANYPFHQNWALSGGASHAEFKNSNALNRISDSTSVTTNLGLRYVTGLGNSIGVQWTHSDADFSNSLIAGGVVINNSYVQDTLALTANYVAGGMTTASMQLGATRRESQQQPGDSSTGATGRLSINRKLSGLTDVQLDLVREYAPPENITTNETFVDSALLAVQWVPTGALRFRGTAGALRRESGLNPAISTTQRVDTITSLGLSVTYTPIRSLTLGLSASRDSRSSNVPGFDYDANVGSATAQFTW